MTHGIFRSQKKTNAIKVFSALTLLIILLFPACYQGIEEWDDGTLKVIITGAEEHDGKNFYYTADTWLPAERRSLDDEAVITGFMPIADGGVTFFVKDPLNPEDNYIFKGNNVVNFQGYIDVDNSGSDQGGIDMTMDDMLSNSRSININGNIVIEAQYPDDFHISESGSPGFWIGSDAGGFSGDETKDLGNITAGTSREIECSLDNSGIALLTLTGDPPVTFTGTDSVYFTVTLQPPDSSTTYGIIPGDSVPFILTIHAPTEPGTYTAELTIPFDDSLVYEPENQSPFTATMMFTVP